MRHLTLLLLAAVAIACGPPEPAGNNGGGGGTDAGQRADTGSTPDAGQQATTICDVHAAGTFNICGGCHGQRGGLAIDNSSPAALYNSLINSTGNSRRTLVEPEDKEASYLWERLTASGVGDVMPPGGMLDMDLLDPLGAWIDEGASSDCL